MKVPFEAKSCRCCDRAYATEEAWLALPHQGDHTDEFGFALEYRNCSCGSTLAVERERPVLALITSAYPEGVSGAPWVAELVAMNDAVSADEVDERRLAIGRGKSRDVAEAAAMRRGGVILTQVTHRTLRDFRGIR